MVLKMNFLPRTTNEENTVLGSHGERSECSDWFTVRFT